MGIRLWPGLDKPYCHAELYKLPKATRLIGNFILKKVDNDDSDLNCKSVKLYR